MDRRGQKTGNLILTGFMGTGKSVVGRRVAEQLGRPFVDMDIEIETRAGEPIRRIFAEDGEPRFREMESRLLTELLGGSGKVIATGGGTLVDPDNRATLSAFDTVVCLHAAPDAILSRTGHNHSRPLLAVDEPAAEIERLLALRRKAYAALPWHVDTTRLSVSEVARRVLALDRSSTLPVQFPGGTYDIHLGPGMLDHIGGALRAAGTGAGTRVALVSNDVVAALYADQVEDSLRAAALHPFRCLIPDGEAHKTLVTVRSLYDRFLEGGLDRSGLVLSLGGGVTGDIAGFAAASFMRGIPFAQAPTTLLAMVDASVGGKTGVDLPQGKNLVGAFKQPLTVVVDPNVLSTLDEAEVRSGMAEVIKHGIIGAPDLFAELKKKGPHHTTSFQDAAPLTPTQLARALQVKIDVVEEDPFEQGLRATLNLGHTVGHALEMLSHFALRHGEAVGIGMAAAARIAVAQERAEPQLIDRIESMLASWDLPTRCSSNCLGPFTAERIWEALAHDKKRHQNTLRWILPLAIGQVTISEDVPQALVLSVLRDLGAS